MLLEVKKYIINRKSYSNNYCLAKDIKPEKEVGMETFLVFFYILDLGYEYCKGDDLGGFLGSISPELWEDGYPADMAILDDWNRFEPQKKINKLNIINEIYDFLNDYEKEFGYDFHETRLWLVNEVDDEIVEKAIAKSKIMMQRHEYE